jgi:hypothetical protein
MLSQSHSIYHQNDDQYYAQDNNYLSTSLPLAQSSQSSSTELLTSPFHPSSLDEDLYFLNGDPLNAQGMNLLDLASQNEGTAMNFDTTFGGNTSDIPTLNDFAMSSFPVSCHIVWTIYTLDYGLLILLLYFL